MWLASPQAAFLHGKFVTSNCDVGELMAMKDHFQADGDLGKILLRVAADE